MQDSYHKRKHAEEMKHQLVVFGMMIFLTLVAFLSVYLKLSVYFIVPFILLLACVQVIFQLYYFMHMKHEGHGYVKLFMYSAMVVAAPILLAMSLIVWW